MIESDDQVSPGDTNGDAVAGECDAGIAGWLSGCAAVVVGWRSTASSTRMSSWWPLSADDDAIQQILRSMLMMDIPHVNIARLTEE